MEYLVWEIQELIFRDEIDLYDYLDGLGEFEDFRNQEYAEMLWWTDNGEELEWVGLEDLPQYLKEGYIIYE